MIHYAAVTADGEVLGVEDNVEDAVDLALEIEPNRTVQVQDVEEEPAAGYIDNPPGSMVKKSVARSGVKPISDRALDMDLKEAQQRLMPFFQGLSAKQGKPVRAYNSVAGMVDAWIGQNYKTSKEHPEEPSKVMGLAMVPHHLLLDMSQKPEVYGDVFTDRLQRWMPRLPKAFSFCVGSNQMCRDSCLVFTGQNAAALYNSHRKAVQAMAFLREPEAFMRVLVAAVAKHQCTSPVEGLTPYMRLNVLSDIPWEEIAPWFFDYFRDLQFYDYTKVAGREPPPNYDLTFSFSGDNKRLCMQEIEAGRRVAVVFLAQKRKGQKWEAWKRGTKTQPIPLPSEFWGLPVLDGDVSDVRPLDEAPAIVALRWKSPSGKKAGVYVDPIEEGFTFVTPTYVVGAEASLYEPNPGEEIDDDEDQFLVAAQTPRHLKMRHTVGQPGGV